MKEKNKKPNTSYTTAKTIDGLHEVMVVWKGWHQQSMGRVVNNGEKTIVYMESEIPFEKKVTELENELKSYRKISADYNSSMKKLKEKFKKEFPDAGK